jgi:arylformamidase
MSGACPARRSRECRRVHAGAGRAVAPDPGALTQDWRGLDAASLEREYSPSSCIGGNYQPFLDAYAQRSRAARDRVPGRLNLHYGSAPAQRLDLFVPPPAAGRGVPPLLVFIHGGYWQELSKDESAFAAADCVERGIACAVLDYTLAPQATLTQIVAECRQALVWLHAQAPVLGVDARRIVVAGSSAGAHLAAMVALRETVAGVAPVPIHAVVLVSGIYELEPLTGTSINRALGLDVATARELSPGVRDLSGFPPAVVCWGSVETTQFKQQSLAFAARLGRACRACRMFEVPQRNHFDVILDLADDRTELGRATLGVLTPT